MILKTHDLQIYLGENSVSSKIQDLQINPKQLVLISGDNGSGKTTYIKTLLNINQPFNGTIDWKIHKDDIFYLPQMGNLHFFLPLKFHELPKGNLKHKDKNWNTSSGGERQQYFLNLALSSQSKLLILDEPFNHLDQKMKTYYIDQLTNYVQQGGSIIMISHEKTIEPLKPNSILYFEKNYGID